MLQKRLLWLTKCVLFCLLGMFVAGRLSGLLNPLVWWAFHHSRATFLSRSSFIADYYLPLIGIYGFSLGLVPINRVKELLASSFGNFQFKSHVQPEMIFNRPLLWAWVPVGLVFAFRLFTFPLGRVHSVLGSTTYGESRFEHFFAPPSLYFASDWSAWIFDRFILTGPTFFLLAYAAGVWLRHQYPEHTTRPAEPQQDES